MTAGGSKSLPSIGFLTVTEHAEHGLFGGYLILNTAARPLEFHCTAPVRPNRAQEILYGPTLKPYLYGEQIAHTLFTKARHRPLWICTDVIHVLELRSLIDIPVVQLIPEPVSAERAGPTGDAPGRSDGAEDRAANTAQGPQAAQCSPTLRFDAAHRQGAGHLEYFAMGGFRVAVGRQYADDQGRVRQRWEPYAAGFDLEEPFARIRGAIEEAQRAAR